MQEIKQQLEDLAFAALYPKRYAELDHLVSTRSPEREVYLARVVAEVRQRLGDLSVNAEITGRGKHLWSIYEKMVVKGREFDEIFDLVAIRVDRRLREGLLRRARLHPRPVASRGRAVQGLHRDAEVQPLPVAAHDGHRSERQDDRGPDPHARDASARGMGRRRALGVQGRDLGPGHRLAEPDPRLAGRQRRPGSVHGQPEDRPRAGRGLRLHAEGQGHRRCRSARRRSTSPTRSTPRSVTRASARRSTVSSYHSTTSCAPATRARSSRRRSRVRRRRATGCSSSCRRGPATRSASGSRASAATTCSKRVARSSRRSCAGNGCRQPGSSRPTISPTRRRRRTTSTPRRLLVAIGEHRISGRSIAQRIARTYRRR